MYVALLRFSPHYPWAGPAAQTSMRTCLPERGVRCLAADRSEALGQIRRGYEYRREGARNPFLACEPLAGWRQVGVTERRTVQDFAHRMRWLVGEAYPEAEVVRLVLGNPVSSTGQARNTRRTASLHETFPAAEARLIARRLECHYAPKPLATRLGRVDGAVGLIYWR